MLRSIDSGVSGLQNYQQEMDVIGNNIANVNTIGFKSSRVDFADAFSQTLQPGVPANGAGAGSSPVQIGTGLTTAAIQNNYNQGALNQTGVQTDLAISGAGFFVVRDTASNQQYVTRAGDFTLDANGYLVTTKGLRVQGFSDAALTTNGDIQIDTQGLPAPADANAKVASFSIGRDGKITVTAQRSDGSTTTYTRGQVLLQTFSNPQALSKAGDNLYSGISLAGPLGTASAPVSAAPGTSGLGQLAEGSLELSNVDLANEFAGLITTQRAFQASARVVTTSDELLQELVNLKR